VPAVPDLRTYNESPTDSGTHRSWTWLIGLLAFVGVLVAGWPLSSWQMRQSVAVESIGRMTCTGSKAVDIDRIRDPAYRLVPGMHCRIGFRVTNSAPLTAHLRTATFTLLGPASGIGLRALGANSPTGPGADRVDAVFDLDQNLSSGETAIFTIDAVFNPRGCEVAGARVIVTQVPTVEVSFLKVSGDRHGDGAFAVVGTADSTCPDAS
jgi:hypothetical protein